MQINVNLNQENPKNNNEKKYYSAKGYCWYERATKKPDLSILKEKFNLNLLIAKLAVGRGVSAKNYANFVEPKIKNLLPDPNVLDHMERATLKIVEFIKKKKKIGIFGDYDVDGSTATAIICNYFDDIGIKYEYYIPDRIAEGYGPNIDALKQLQNKNCELILTLDCGTSAKKTINLMQKSGAEIIIVDHHLEADSLPNAFAIINPKKKSDSSKLTNLCAAGVVFFLLISINRKLKEIRYFPNDSPNLLRYLDLVALGTICDLVKLDDLNRAFVKQGIKIINNTRNLGLTCLIKDSSINQVITEYHLGYVLGPRINAGGRVGNSILGADLLITKKKSISSVISKKLCDYNNLRKIIERRVEFDAMQQAGLRDENIICVHSKNWHPGVIGIVASKLTEKFSRPSIVISEDSEICKASCRSVKSFDIGNFIIMAIKNGKILSGGGHKMAGGFEIERSKIEDFKIFLRNKHIRQQNDLLKNFDSELNISSLNHSLYYEINKFSPFGVGNPKPKFLIRDCLIKFVRLVGKKHFSFCLEDSYGNRIKGIAFNSLGTKLGNLIETCDSNVSVIVSLTINRWAGNETVELLVEDMIV
jgi:single-stranded-DNA-specific exonuclease